MQLYFTCQAFYEKYIHRHRKDVIMKFGEKLKLQRKAAGYTQTNVANKLGVSLRTVINYESGERYPKKREIYANLAELFGVETNYFLSEEEEFLLDASNKYGYKGAKQAQALINEVSGLFAGGEMEEEDMDNMMQAIQEAYWIAKKNNRKYTPKKYRKE